MLCGACLACGYYRKMVEYAVWGMSGMWLDKVRHCGKMVE